MNQHLLFHFPMYSIRVDNITRIGLILLRVGIVID